MERKGAAGPQPLHGVRPPHTPFGPTADDHLTRVRPEAAQRGRQVIRHATRFSGGPTTGAEPSLTLPHDGQGAPGTRRAPGGVMLRRPRALLV